MRQESHGGTNYVSHDEKNLKTKLQEFLVCRKSQEEWKLERGSKDTKVTQLRFIQKQMPQDSVFVNGQFHNGAHMNLLVWTENPKRQGRGAKAKSKDKQTEKWRSGHQRSGNHWGSQQWKGHQWSNGW